MKGFGVRGTARIAKERSRPFQGYRIADLVEQSYESSGSEGLLAQRILPEHSSSRAHVCED